ncbi:hypothetical protein SSX86_016158 [Deinandra increscens subsp. villosa]|uniref:Glutaredoxin domain-containing protein n=1 Tax=Deinandra increscens subsp. villosa TaxID=3103831 RepID=A0AAP0CZ46_9ASTR
MGCTSSKQPVCRNCHAQYSPVRTSSSSLPNRSPPRETDNRHVVSLTSTTLAYLLIDSSTIPNQLCEDPRQDPEVARIPTQPVAGQNVPRKGSEDFALGVIETKTWSKMIDEKITKMEPKTPVLTPPGEPETINEWELMEGLDDSSPLIDDNISNLITLNQPTFLSNSNSNSGNAMKERLILYFTSLRGVRKTYEDCRDVRAILKNSGVRVDERDVSMHSGFKEELKELLGDGCNGGGLPKVFVGKKCIGGVDEIRRFHDEYRLDKVLEGCETVDDRHGDDDGGIGGCEGCGDVRFLPCETCSGSCKIYYEENSDVDEDEEVEENDCGFQRCPHCNENGLIRCPFCCD